MQVDLVVLGRGFLQPLVVLGKQLLEDVLVDNLVEVLVDNLVVVLDGLVGILLVAEL